MPKAALGPDNGSNSAMRGGPDGADGVGATVVGAAGGGGCPGCGGGGAARVGAGACD